MNEPFQALFLPANIWRPIQTITIPATDQGSVSLDTVRNILDCRLIEVINPTSDALAWMHLTVGVHVGLGDEEGRLVAEHHANYRATKLLGFPYMLVGDIVILGDDETDYARTFTSINPNLLAFLQDQHS